MCRKRVKAEGHQQPARAGAVTSVALESDGGGWSTTATGGMKGSLLHSASVSRAARPIILDSTRVATAREWQRRREKGGGRKGQCWAGQAGSQRAPGGPSIDDKKFACCCCSGAAAESVGYSASAVAGMPWSRSFTSSDETRGSDIRYN